MIGPPLWKSAKRFVFWIRALRAPPRVGSRGSRPFPFSTRLWIPAVIEASSGRTAGRSDPDCGIATPAVFPPRAAKSAIGPIRAKVPWATLP